mmetsp:Transcript_12747/g.27794  ORF Transcript_12747/g.27794 Transcript_12747/m.27794 type:complete len:420 (+) Transcript_12747:179-1438(+)
MGLGWVGGTLASVVLLFVACAIFRLILAGRSRGVLNQSMAWMLFVLLFLSLIPTPCIIFSPVTHVAGVGVLSVMCNWWVPLRMVSTLLNIGPTAHILNTPKLNTHAKFFGSLMLPVHVTFDASLTSTLPSAAEFAVSAIWHQLVVISLIALVLPFLEHYLLVDQPVLLSVIHPFCYASAVYATARMLLDGASVIAVAGFQLPCDRSFCAPWLSTSLRQFWSRRWNAVASANLRDGVFTPIFHAGTSSSSSAQSTNSADKTTINDSHSSSANGNTKNSASGVNGVSHVDGGDGERERSRRRKEKRLWTMVGVLMSFAASGVFHEWILYNVTGELHLDWLAFFVVQGVLCLLEASVLEPIFFRRVPILVQWAVTIAVLTVTTGLFFFRPLRRGDLRQRAFSNLTEPVDMLRAAVTSARSMS